MSTCPKSSDSSSDPSLMDPRGWPVSDVKTMAEEIERLGIASNVLELELFGLTVVDAALTGASELAGRALHRVFDLIEERSGTRPDSEQGTSHADVFLPSLFRVLHEDAVFQDLMMHPTLVGLVSYLLGQRCVVSSTAVFMKGPVSGGAPTKTKFAVRGTGLQLGLHSDTIQRPEPFPPYAELCNATWLLSDYSKENGALVFVPGSHRQRRHPREGEGVELAVPVEAPMGSLVVWHGNTWHGSFPNTVPGLRTGLAFEFCRAYIARHERFDDVITDEMFERHPERFATLAGGDVLRWTEDGPDYDKLLKWPLRPTTFT
jgi:ectoine hydroxylase-related dioxygenase (phytanoyl-CoA dioxygenase family)